jgi:hypothetical protein
MVGEKEEFVRVISVSANGRTCYLIEWMSGTDFPLEFLDQ